MEPVSENHYSTPPGMNPLLLQSVAEEICESLLGIELETSEAFPNGLAIITACISLTSAVDDENYLLFIDCDNRLLDWIAEKVYSQHIDHLEVEEMLNALEELANMIAGELVTVLEKEYQLGLPLVVDAMGNQLEISDEEISAEVVLKHRGAYLRIILTQL